MNSDQALLLQPLSNHSISVNSSDINEEARENLFYLSATEENKANVQNFVESSIEIIKEKLLLHYSGLSMTFYCWVDELAGQLRFSFISTHHNKLPFSCSLNIVDDLHIILSRFRNASDGIRTKELIEIEAVEPSPNDTEEDFTLDVWTKII